MNIFLMLRPLLVLASIPPLYALVCHIADELEDDKRRRYDVETEALELYAKLYEALQKCRAEGVPKELWSDWVLKAASQDQAIQACLRQPLPRLTDFVIEQIRS